jgi:hypothetical protein
MQCFLYFVEMPLIKTYHEPRTQLEESPKVLKQPNFT